MPNPARTDTAKPPQRLAVLIMLVTGAAMLFLARLGLYARLLADDFCSVYFAKRLGMLRYIWYWFLTWGGRYSAIAVDSWIQYVGEKGVRFVPFFVLSIWCLATAFAVAPILERELGGRQGKVFSAAAGLTFVFAVVFVSPNVPQVLFWWNGMRTYVPALILFTLHVGFLYWIRERLTSRGTALLGLLVSFGFAFLSAGFNETFTAIQVLLFGEWMVLGIVTRRLHVTDRFFFLLLAAEAATLFALAIMLLAPGAALRQAYFTPSPSLTATLTVAAQGYWNELVRMFTSPGAALAVGLTFVTFTWLGSGAADGKRPTWLEIAFPFFNGLLLSFGSLIPAVQGTSEIPAARTFIVPTFLFLTGLACSSLWLGKRLGWALTRSGAFSAALVAFLLVSAGWNVQSLYASRHVYADYAVRWDADNVHILQAKQSGAAQVTIPVTNDNWAQLEEPNDNPKYWVTACYSLYYGIQVFGEKVNP